MNFNSRETYLAAVSEWKKEYQRVSDKLRAKKRERDERQRAGKCQMLVVYDIINAKREARLMIKERHAGKVEAQRQYMSTRQV